MGEGCVRAPAQAAHARRVVDRGLLMGAIAALVMGARPARGMASDACSELSSSASSVHPAQVPALLLGFVRREGSPPPARAHVDKLGGLPSWPHPPPPQELQAPGCPACDQRMPFVLSVVQPPAPGREREDCLHVFACRDAGCARSTNAVRVFRSQRPLPLAADPACLQAPTPGCMPPLVLRERALDFEEFPDEDGFLEGEDHIEQLMQQYQQGQGSHDSDAPGAAGAGASPDEDDTKVEDTSVDKVQIAFSRRIAAAPAQAVRYYPRLDGDQDSPMDCEEQESPVEPLWVAERGRMAGSAPPCARCNGKRRLELQVMPQILNFVEVPEEGADALGAAGDSRTGGRGEKGKKAGRAAGYDTFQLQMDMDWGTIAAFVCASRCNLLNDDTGSGFCEEFAWRQVFPP
jgi:hypothetical protein